jgi:hypothetical protein
MYLPSPLKMSRRLAQPQPGAVHAVIGPGYGEAARHALRVESKSIGRSTAL